jgi:hypothetical protein
MLNTDLRELIRAVSFQPFEIRLVTGESFQVEHRDFLWLPPSSRSAAVHTSKQGVVTILNTGLIARISYLDVAITP